MLFKISIKYYITIIFSLFSFVKRYAVRNVKIRQYAVRRVKIRPYAVRKGEGGDTLICTLINSLTLFISLHYKMYMLTTKVYKKAYCVNSDICYFL